MKQTCITFILLIVFSLSGYSQLWTQKTDFPGQARFAATGFSNNGFSYICAGSINNTNHFTDLWQYNPSTDSWSSKASFPGTARRRLVSFTIDSLSFVGLGFNYSQNTLFNDLYSYNPSSNTWTALASFPGNLTRGAEATSLNGKAYVIGGSNGLGISQLSNQIWEYDPIMDSWTQKANFPFTARMDGIAFSSDSLIYFGLGHNGSVAFQDLWAYNPITNTWTQKDSFPGIPRFNSSVFVLNGKIIAGGGTGLNSNGSTPFSSDYYAYDPTLDSWTTLPSFLNGSRAHSVAFAVNNKGYIVSGWNSNKVSTKDVWEYTDTTITTGIDKIDYMEHSTLVYPNPTQGKIFISNQEQDISAANIFDSKGNLVLSETVMSLNKNYELDISSLPNGIYFYQLRRINSLDISGKILLNK